MRRLGRLDSHNPLVVAWLDSWQVLGFIRTGSREVTERLTHSLLMLGHYLTNL